MHLLPTQAGDLTAPPQAEDLGQTPADVLLLSFSDSDLSAVAAAWRALPATQRPGLRLASLSRLLHPLSVDLYADRVVAGARLVVVRLNGGIGYWRHGVDRLREVCRAGAIPLALLPGEAKPDPALVAASTLPAGGLDRLWRYFVEGGPDNMASLLTLLRRLASGEDGAEAPPALPLPRFGRYQGWTPPPLAADAQVVAVVFYRSHLQAGNLAPFHDLADALAARGLRPIPFYAASLKEDAAAHFLTDQLAALHPAVVINATAFSSRPATGGPSPLEAAGVPVLQAVLSTGDEAAWAAGRQGLGPADLAMSVVLPEMDGHLLGPAIAFKAAGMADPDLQYAPQRGQPRADRVAALADRARALADLAATPPARRRLAVVLSDYPARGGAGLALGLDTPASTLAVLRALAAAGYALTPANGPTGALDLSATTPEAGVDLMRALTAGDGARLTLREYEALLDAPARAAITAAWGPVAADPLWRADGEPGFGLRVLELGVPEGGVPVGGGPGGGGVVVAVQPSRGHGALTSAAHHDPDTPPSHGYAAFHLWLRHRWGAQALIQMGAHGTLEWLPGKAVALSADCWPERLAGGLPVFYPYIVTNPGEGVQARRRLGAALIGHLPPPPRPAGLHGDLAALEQALDEYAQAQSLDPRRLPTLHARIRDLAWSAGLTRDLDLPADLGFSGGMGAGVDGGETALTRLDAHLCDIKEMQIGDGLHVLGSAPGAEATSAFLAALARFPRGSRPSLSQALARDLDLEGPREDIFTADPATPWPHPLPPCLRANGAGPAGRMPTERITVGRVAAALDSLARDLVAGHRMPDPTWSRTLAALSDLRAEQGPALALSGPLEMAALLDGLDGKAIAAGPGGSPARGRAEVLPTGRNLYAIDPRAVPTPAAWALGWRGADAVLTRHLQDHGDWPAQLVIDCWGSPTLRTGGEELAQAMALMGVRPLWDGGSGRVTGVEVLPASILGRPRVDVTLRISGLFRDLFPRQIEIFDRAVAQVAALDEGPDINPLAARVRAERAELDASGAAAAGRLALARVFGAAPGGYGAGLASRLATGEWRQREELGTAYLDVGCHAYGEGLDGVALPALFRRRVGAAQALVHVQDTRDGDILDNDGMTQFIGGFAAAAALLGATPALYHVDSAQPGRVVPRTVGEEVGRVVRGRATNPLWIAGMRRHGHSGAAHLARTIAGAVDLAALSGTVRTHQLDSLFAAYVADEATWEFIATSNGEAAGLILDRLEEAARRGLWHPGRNDTGETLAVRRAGLAAAPPTQDAP